ncbi:MAG: biopolymer transporter ExbB [Pseudopedobacter saltans]|uniref:Biopolymer transporter ExbB n=1 Tax=Pseudopedobacter saltans TaxID=151895 RepID=A0A2W5FFC1_9SPHI|nr:MAG: biopolymer transporter ExbB [Pseudopedobacter saltans]
MGILLQVLDSSSQAVSTVAAHGTEKMSLWSLLGKGGALMYPLYILLIIALYVFFERFLVIKKARSIDPNFMRVIHDNIVSNNVSSAYTMAKNSHSPIAHVIAKGLQRLGKPIDVIEKSMEGIAEIELYSLERNLNILSLIAGIAPMFGFLGTIAGMVQLFYEINTTGNFDLSVISGGIYVKMITSGTGLVIGLLAYIMYNFLSTQVDKMANQIEIASADFMDILQGPIN